MPLVPHVKSNYSATHGNPFFAPSVPFPSLSFLPPLPPPPPPPKRSPSRSSFPPRPFSRACRRNHTDGRGVRSGSRSGSSTGLVGGVWLLPNMMTSEREWWSRDKGTLYENIFPPVERCGRPLLVLASHIRPLSKSNPGGGSSSQHQENTFKHHQAPSSSSNHPEWPGSSPVPYLVQTPRGVPCAI